MTTYILDARTATPHFPGIGRYVVNLATELPPLLRAGEELHLLTPAAHTTLPPDFAAGRPAVTTHATRVSPFALAQQWAIPAQLRPWRGTLGARRAVYHSTYYLMPYRPGLPTVLTVYDLIALTRPETVSWRARLFFRVATRLALAASEHVIAISLATQRDLQARFGLPPSRITTIPLAPAAHFRPPTDAAIARARAAYHLPPHYFLYVGINKPHKNLVRLVEAYALLDASAPPLLIGGAWDARYPAAKVRAAELGLGERARFLGPIDDEHLPALYGACTLFVYPSRYEGFGLPVIEAMACGAAVACSHAPGLEDAAGDAALRFAPDDVTGLAAVLREAATHSDVCAALRQRGLAHARRFSWRRVANETLAVYRDLAGRGRTTV